VATRLDHLRHDDVFGEYARDGVVLGVITRRNVLAFVAFMNEIADDWEASRYTSEQNDPRELASEAQAALDRGDCETVMRLARENPFPVEWFGEDHRWHRFQRPARLRLSRCSVRPVAVMRTVRRAPRARRRRVARRGPPGRQDDGEPHERDVVGAAA
jgi:hypothetical protein